MLKLLSCRHCGRDIYCKKMCRSHYDKWRAHGDPLWQRVKLECSVSGCENIHEAKGYCCSHYNRWKKHGDPLGGKYKVGRHNKYGYIIIFMPGHPNAYKSDGRILEHRYVMSECLGRPLLKNEQVHHKNGNRSDNRIKNLELWSTSQPPGQRVEDKVEWAREILKLYGELY